jgi:hypothetical protein
MSEYSDYLLRQTAAYKTANWSPWNANDRPATTAEAAALAASQAALKTAYLAAQSGGKRPDEHSLGSNQPTPR